MANKDYQTDSQMSAYCDLNPVIIEYKIVAWICTVSILSCPRLHRAEALCDDALWRLMSVCLSSVCRVHRA